MSPHTMSGGGGRKSFSFQSADWNDNDFGQTHFANAARDLVFILVSVWTDSFPVWTDSIFSLGGISLGTSPEESFQFQSGLIQFHSRLIPFSVWTDSVFSLESQSGHDARGNHSSFILD